MKVGFAELGKKSYCPKNIMERFGRTKRSKRYPRKILADKRSNNIRETVGADKRSKRYPRKMLGWTKDPKDILERFWGGQKIQKRS